MAGGYRAISAVGAVSGDGTPILPDRGKGVKRTIIVHVYNAANATVFFAHDKQTLVQPMPVNDVNFGTQAGIPIGKNGAVSPFTIFDWEGPLWMVASLQGTMIAYEEGFN